jgi:3-deoxy-manno-octulosonate cytidylyltransferase (CMP-KDO synthetase)
VLDVNLEWRTPQEAKITLGLNRPAHLALLIKDLEKKAIESGFRIRAMETRYDSIGVDTPADLERVRRLVATGLPH